jgi:ankyrin repeat protein
MMKYVIVLIGSLCCATASDNRIGSAHIVNDADHTLNAEIGIPKRCQADVIITKIDAQEALFKAIRKDLAKDVCDAVRDGADVNQKIQNQAPLVWAVLLNRLKVVPELLQLGAVVDTECIRVAMRMGSVIVPALVKHWNNVAYAQDTTRLLSEVCNFIKGHDLNPTVALEFVREFIRKGFVLDESVWDEVFSKANRASNKECALELIKEAADYCADINELWYVALRLAAYRPYYGEVAVKFLLARGANPNREFSNKTPLGYAASSLRNKKIVQLLLAAGADVHKPLHNRSILYVVIQQGGGDDLKKNEMVELLLEHGAEL